MKSLKKGSKNKNIESESATSSEYKSNNSSSPPSRFKKMSSPVKLKKISPTPKKSAKVDHFSIGPSPLRNSSFDYRKPTDAVDFMQNDLFDVQ